MKPLWIHLAIALVLCRAVNGEEECSSTIQCYECNSWTDPLCFDPFNFTLPLEKQPPVEKCEGCCVKLVQNIGTPNYSIRRTCTKEMKINLFMVDHVCMLESNGKGHMCFCEEDFCNKSPSSLSGNSFWMNGLFLLIAWLFSSPGYVGSLLR